MEISVSDPFSSGMTRMSRMLFKPFVIGKWFTIGFAAFLAMLGEGPEGNLFNQINNWGGPRLRLPRGPRGGTPGGPASQPPDILAEVWHWVVQNAWWIGPGLVGAFVLWVVIVWLRARGKFVFVDCVARNQGAIVEPWKRLAMEANSLFRFELLVSVVLAILAIASGGLSLVIALPDIRGGTFTGAGITAISVGIVLGVLLLVVYLLISAIAENFLIPLMYARSQMVGAAWHEFRTRILPGHVGIILGYFLLRGVLNIGAATLITFGLCLTCFVAAIPYLGTVLFLPVFVFMRAYSLEFFAQFGPDYNVLVAEVPLAAFPVIFNEPPPLPPPPLPQEQGGA